MNEEYIPAIITASVALIAATGAQLLAHWLTSRRLEKERNDKIYQEFIYPFLPDVLLYYETKTNFRKGHDVEKEVDIKDLLYCISKKVSYGNMKLLSCYYNIVQFNRFFDGKGGSRERNTLRFMFWYLDYVYLILTEKKPIEKDILNKVLLIQKLYGIWIMVLEEVYEGNIANEFMMHDFLFYSLMDEIDVNIIKDIVDNAEDYFEKRFNLLNIIIRQINMKSGKENVILLEEYLLAKYRDPTSQLEDTD